MKTNRTRPLVPHFHTLRVPDSNILQRHGEKELSFSVCLLLGRVAARLQSSHCGFIKWPLRPREHVQDHSRISVPMPKSICEGGKIKRSNIYINKNKTRRYHRQISNFLTNPRLSTKRDINPSFWFLSTTVSTLYILGNLILYFYLILTTKRNIYTLISNKSTFS